MKLFYVIGFQRSGTSVLNALLCERPNVFQFGQELIASNFFGSFLGAWTTHHRREAHLVEPVLAAMVPVENEQTDWRGFKAVVNNHKTAEQAVSGLQDGFLSLKGIVIVRNDLVAQIGSAKLARLTKVYHAWDHHGEKGGSMLQSEVPRVSIELGPEMRHWICSIILGQRSLIRFAKRHSQLLLSYEEDLLAVGPCRAMAKIDDCLGLDSFHYPYHKYPKVSPRPEEFIENYVKASSLVESLQGLSDADLAREMARLEAHLRRKRRLKRLLSRIGR